MKQLSTTSHGCRSRKITFASGNRLWMIGIRAMLQRMLVEDRLAGRGRRHLGQQLEIEPAQPVCFLGAEAREPRLVAQSEVDLGKDRTFLEHMQARDVHQQGVEQGRARPREADEEDRRRRRSGSISIGAQDPIHAGVRSAALLSTSSR